MLLCVTFSLVEFPCVPHQLNEMIVIVNVSGHSGVVVIPLLLSDHAVAVAVAERGKELDEDLLIGHLTAHHLWVM